MTAVATVPPAPAPVAKIQTQGEKVAAVEKFFGDRLKKIETMLAKVGGLTPEKFVRTVIFAAQKNPELLNCTRQSLFLAALDAALLGLPVGTSQSLAHLIPYRNRDTKQLEASFQVDWKGIVALMLESGEVAKVDLESVHEKDDFEAVVGSPRPNHRLCWKGPRGLALGYYTVVTFKDGTTKWLFMTRDEVEQVRKQYASDDSPAWKKSYDEMAKKTTLKRLAKSMRRIGTAHEKLARALETDGRAEAGETYEPSHDVIEATGEVVEPAPKPEPAQIDARRTADIAKESVAARAAEVAAKADNKQAAPSAQGA